MSATSRGTVQPVSAVRDGPQDCGLVYLVMGDDALRDELAKTRKVAREKASMPPGNSPLDSTDDDELGTDPRLEGLE
mgnify:CR=1 FL=1